jgi:hypothetical protein
MKAMVCSFVLSVLCQEPIADSQIVGKHHRRRHRELPCMVRRATAAKTQSKCSGVRTPAKQLRTQLPVRVSDTVNEAANEAASEAANEAANEAAKHAAKQRSTRPTKTQCLSRQFRRQLRRQLHSQFQPRT